jgi:hypothetical protein
MRKSSISNPEGRVAGEPDRTQSLHGFGRQLLATVPRLLTQLDRDPDSPTFGCFDRDYWHYKIRDFASIVLQQGVLILDTLYHSGFPGNIYHHQPILLAWIDAALHFWASEQLPSGAFNEYYPHEEGFPPTAFSLYAVCLALRRRGEAAVGSPLLEAVQKSADWLMATREKESSNQEAVALVALELAAGLPGVAVDREKLSQRLSEFFSSQSLEGWFPEYGGADTGYLSVTLDALTDYYDLTHDERAAEAADKALHYIGSLITVAGTTPVMTNSRNTDYLVPYGLIRLGAKSPLAARIVATLFTGVDKEDHFLQSTDDRYLCHYVFQSCFRGIERLGELTPEIAGFPAETGGEFFYAEAGIHILHRPGNSSVITAARKGGVLYCYRPAGLAFADYGWRQRTGDGKILVTHWQGPDNRAALHRDGLTITVVAEGRVTAHDSTVPTVLKHAVLRILSYLFGNRLIALLKRRLIFGAADSGIRYRREVTIQQESITITDTFTGAGIDTFVPEPAPAYSLRYVASAANFNSEELFDITSLQRRAERTSDRLVVKTSPPCPGLEGDEA